MSHISRRTVLKGLALGAGSILLGCSNQNDVAVTPSQVRRVRVRLLQDQTQVMLGATANPMVSTASAPTPRGLHFLDRGGAPVTLSSAGWKIGSASSFGIGDLVLQPTTEASLSVNGQTYRGGLRLVALSADHFDVINENIDVDGYLKGVLPRELYPHWNLETYRAQAIVARTYALYEVQTAGRNRYWDLYPDQRSQVYGGVGAETAIARQAVDDTAGIVLAYGPTDKETIFKAYFSSCCGGVTQSAHDAFGDVPLPPLSEQNVGPVCNACTKFNWSPVELKKDELTRRFHAWAKRKAEQEGKARPEEAMALIDRVEITLLNRFNRPARFRVTDVAGKQYVLFSEEFRSAANSAEAPGEPTLYSSFLKIDNRPGSDVVRFVEGHGYGHGVGLCQWCAQARAERGMRHEDILAAAYPKARLVRAY